jgi:hypothetical protein
MKNQTAIQRLQNNNGCAALEASCIFRRLGVSAFASILLRCIFVIFRAASNNTPEESQLWDELSTDRLIQIACNAVYFVPFQLSDYNFWL